VEQNPTIRFCNLKQDYKHAFIINQNSIYYLYYNVVKSLSCPDDSTKYTRACQELIKYAQMGSVIKLIWDGSVTTETPAPIKVRELKLTEVKEEPVKKKKKTK